MDTYGLRTVHIGNRFVRLHGLQFADIIGTIAGLWSAYATQSPMRLYIASPQPPDNPPHTLVVIVEFPTAAINVVTARPILLDLFQNGEESDRRTGYVEEPATVADTFFIHALEDLCWPSGIDDCTLFVGDQFLIHDEDLQVTSGQYMTLHHSTFSLRQSHVIDRFPGAYDFVREFVRRSRHYNINDFWIHVHLTTGQLGERLPSRIMAWSIVHCRNVDAVLQQAVLEWESHGANRESRLVNVWPQSQLQGEQSVIQIILSSTRPRGWLPLLVTIFVHVSGMRPHRVETHAWTLPPAPTIDEFLAFLNYLEFSSSVATSCYITYGRQRFDGGDTRLQLQPGGHYVVNFHITSMTSLIRNTARRLHELTVVSGSDSEVDSGDGDDMSLMQIFGSVYTPLYYHMEPFEEPTHDTSHQSFKCLAARIDRKDQVTTLYIDTRIYPLPGAFEHMAPQGRYYQLMPSWDELCDLLSARGFDQEAPVKFLTYGLREAHAGQRLVRAPVRHPGVVLQAVKNVWWDVIMDNGFQVFLIDPQPEDMAPDTIALLMEVLVPTIDGDMLAPILFEVHKYDENSVGADESLRADYVDRRANAALIYRLGGVTAQCEPQGPSWCTIEHQRRTYSDIDDRFIVPSGSFIVLQVQPTRWHLLDCSDYFYAANMFATAAIAKIADPTDPSIFVRTHAVDANNQQQGHRSLVIHRRLFKDPSAIWHLTSGLWRDVMQDMSTLRLVYSPTPPQLEPEGRLHLIVMQRSLPARVPIIVSYFLPPEIHDEQPVLIGSFASQVATPTNLRTLRGICLPQGHSRMSRTTAHVWCEDRYYAFQETLRPEAGTHILVFAEREDNPQDSEDGEEEDGTDDDQVEEDSAQTGESSEPPSTSTCSSDARGSAYTSGSVHSDDRSYSHRHVAWGLFTSLLVIVPLRQKSFTMVLFSWIATWHFLDRYGYGEILERRQPHVFDRWCVEDVKDFPRVRPASVKMSFENQLTTEGQSYAQCGQLASGCRHDCLRRPLNLSEASFGGSYDGDIATVFCGNNSVWQTHWLSGIPPLRDDEAILGLICQHYENIDHRCHANLYTRSHQDISRQNTQAHGNTPFWIVGAIFGKLCPPGNPPLSFYIGDEEHINTDSADSRHCEVVDVRGVIDLNLLDDCHTCGSTTVIIEVSRSQTDFVKMGPSGINDHQLNSLLIPWPPEVISARFDHIPDIHHLGQQFLDCAEPFDWDMVEDLHIYCDGSAAFCSETGNAFAGCAVVITATTHSDNGTGYSVLGFTGGSICTDPDSMHWWGAQNAQSMEAERTAVLLSMLWFLQSPFAIGHRCTVWFDCTAAGYGASGSWNYPQESVLAELVRGVGQMCEECNPGTFFFEHTHAHVGDPGNELADSAAKAFAQGKLPNLLSCIDISWLVQATLQYGSWLWFHFGTYMGLEDLPPFSGQHIRLPETARISTAPPTSSFIDGSGGNHSWNVNINIATINVKSLYACNEDTDDKTYTPAKASFLSQQLEWGGYGLVGLQECCTKNLGISKIGDYTRVAGESSGRGQLGCEIWLSSKQLHAQVHDICVLHCDERRLVIRVQNASIDLAIASLHSPHSGSTSEERTQWWRQSCSICQRAGKLAPLVVCVDANAQITTPIQHLTGDLLDGKENDNEQHLLTLCRLCKVFAPI